MFRASLLAIALIGPAVAVAQAATGYYVATPATTPVKAQLMTRSTPWRLVAGSYVAPRSPDRDLVVCQLVAREAGRLQGFTIAGAAVDATTLEKCNAHAR